MAATLTAELRNFMDKVAEKPPDAWFHRKSEKLVLAVLMVNVDGKPHFVPGINAEVSLPAGGSFCAERSAIVAARALFPGISREDFAGIAVLEVPLKHDRDPLRSRNPLRPCGACTEWLTKLQEANPSFRVVTYTSLDLVEIEEFLPDGRQWELPDEAETSAAAVHTHTDGAVPLPTTDDDAGTEAVATGVEEPEEGSGRDLKARHRTTLARLVHHWPPPKAFRRDQVKRRIPWFPAWWFDDLVKRGHVIAEGDKSDPKRTKYRVARVEEEVSG